MTSLPRATFLNLCSSVFAYESISNVSLCVDLLAADEHAIS